MKGVVEFCMMRNCLWVRSAYWKERHGQESSNLCFQYLCFKSPAACLAFIPMFGRNWVASLTHVFPSDCWYWAVSYMITKYQTSWVISLMQLWLVEVHESHHLSFVCITALVNLGLFFARVRNNIPRPIIPLHFLLTGMRMGIMWARHPMHVQQRLCSNLVDSSGGERLIVLSWINPLLFH